MCLNKRIQNIEVSLLKFSNFIKTSGAFEMVSRKRLIFY